MALQICKIFSKFVRLQDTPGQQDFVGRRESQMLHGEEFEIIGFHEDVPGDLSTWAHGRSLLDGYEGWMIDTNLVHAGQKPTHAVIQTATNAYLKPHFKAARDSTFSFMSRLTCISEESQNGFLKLASLTDRHPDLWVPERDTLPIDQLRSNPRTVVDTARILDRSPYGYGGRSVWGIDCSGLNQVVAQSKGFECARDADQQVDTLGKPIKNFGDRKAGDFIFFKDGETVHTGILISRHMVLNASARTMVVKHEPLDSLIAHYGQGKGRQAAILAIRRLEQ